ncbi:MAG: tripartite tricarboxylate transporter substrate binding protein [Pseudomonadota bacterium]
MKKLFVTAAAGLLATGLTAATQTPAQAADLSCDTATLIVPWKAGGGTHVIFSIFEKTIAEMDVPTKVKVVSIGGQGGNKGAKQAAKAKPDGCTLFAIHQSAFTSFLNGRIDFHYDGFETVANLTSTPDIIGGATDVPYKSWEEFAEYAKANPEGVKAGTTFGSTSHFLYLLLGKKMGVEFSYVPYDGTAERMTALLSGAIDTGALNVASGSKHLESGALQAFAIASEERAPQLPDLPTLKEVGVDMVSALERGIVAPKGTPREVVDYWAGVFKAALEDPSLQEQMAAKGTGLRFQGPDEFRAWADALYADYEAVAIDIGMFKK